MNAERTRLFRLPETLPEQLQSLCDEIAGRVMGDVSAERLQAALVPMGVYQQRDPDRYMARVRLPGGMILPRQIERLAKTADEYGEGPVHVTTRQDMQIHGVPLENIYPTLEQLLEVGLSTKDGGGNTVRNVTACPDAGACPHERFDVTPHVLALTEYLLGSSEDYSLPRKYKLSITGCEQDCAGAMLHDLGFVGRVIDGVRGFAVYVAGGLGRSPRIATLLEAFVSEDQIHLTAEAVRRLFNRYGNRENRNRARLRFVMAEHGFDWFLQMYRDELLQLDENIPERLDLDRFAREPQAVDAGPTSDTEESADRTWGTEPTGCENFDFWRARTVQPEKRAGLFSVTVPLVLGDIQPHALERLAMIVAYFGDGVLRATQTQNVMIRGVKEHQLRSLQDALCACGLGEALTPIELSAVACTGASTCRLGICHSRGLLAAIHRAFSRAKLDLLQAGDVRLYVNGCPNSCGRHPIASIGLAGCARKINGRSVPHYTVQLGGRLGERTVRLAEGRDKLPARNVPNFLVDLLMDFRGAPEYPDFDAYLDAGGREVASRLGEKYQAVPDFDHAPEFYRDWEEG